MVPGGPGQRAGLVVGDVVLEVNGQNVEAKSVEDIIVLVKEGGNFLSLRITKKANYNTVATSKLPTRNMADIQVKFIFKLLLLLWMLLLLLLLLRFMHLQYIFWFLVISQQKENDDDEISYL